MTLHVHRGTDTVLSDHDDSSTSCSSRSLPADVAVELGGAQSRQRRRQLGRVADEVVTEAERLRVAVGAHPAETHHGNTRQQPYTATHVSNTQQCTSVISRSEQRGL